MEGRIIERPNWETAPLQGNLINHKHKIGYVFLPKCGGSSVCHYLQALDPNWEMIDDEMEMSNIQAFRQYPHYKIFSVIRHPVDWVLSGYRYFRHLNLSLDEHLDLALNPTKKIMNVGGKTERILWGDWFNHCGVTPDIHLNDRVRVFKLETEIPELRKYLGKIFPLAKYYDFPHINKTEPMEINLTKEQVEKILKLTWFYGQKYRYNFAPYISQFSDRQIATSM